MAKRSDYHDVTALVRLVEDVTIPPQHVVSCQAKYHKQFDTNNETDLLVRQSETSFLNDEPGLLIMNGLTNVNHRRRLPLTFVNTTNRHFTLQKGNVVATVERLGDAELSEIQAEVDYIVDSNKVVNEVKHTDRSTKHKLSKEVTPNITSNK